MRKKSFKEDPDGYMIELYSRVSRLEVYQYVTWLWLGGITYLLLKLAGVL
ncbi:MAG: hypothetical protein QXT64_03925 [Desulfurococcaceae archaeon]